MRLVSINVGQPRLVEWNGKTIETGIFKDPVTGPVRVARTNLAGDGQADTGRIARSGCDQSDPVPELP